MVTRITVNFVVIVLAQQKTHFDRGHPGRASTGSFLNFLDSCVKIVNHCEKGRPIRGLSKSLVW